MASTLLPSKQAPFRGYAIIFHWGYANKEVKSIILESSKNDAASTTASTAAMKRGLCVKFSQQANVSACIGTGCGSSSMSQCRPLPDAQQQSHDQADYQLCTLKACHPQNLHTSKKFYPQKFLAQRCGYLL